MIVLYDLLCALGMVTKRLLNGIVAKALFTLGRWVAGFCITEKKAYTPFPDCWVQHPILFILTTLLTTKHDGDQ